MVSKQQYLLTYCVHQISLPLFIAPFFNVNQTVVSLLLKTKSADKTNREPTKQPTGLTSSDTNNANYSSSSSSQKKTSERKPRALNFDPVNRPRRQDWKGDLVENGMLYFARRHLIETDRVLQGGNCTYVEVPPNLSIEIDSSLDLAHAEQTVLHEGLQPYLLP